MTGARALASWHHAAQLEHLNLRGAGVPPKGRALLRGSPLAGALLIEARGGAIYRGAPLGPLTR